MRSKLKPISDRLFACHPEGACARRISEILRLRRASKGECSTPLRTRRRKSTTSCSGSMSIALAIVAPLLVALLAVVVNVGMLLHARARLQIATDRGVYAGAASIAHDMNRIARANWGIHSEYARLEDWLNGTSEPSEEEINNRFSEARSRQAELFSQIRDINAGMFGRAVEVARSVAAANVPGAEFVPFFEPPDDGMMQIGGESDDEHYGFLSGADIEGTTFDPENYDIEDPVQTLKYFEKNDGRSLFFGGWVISESPSPVFASLFGDKTEIAAAAGAQPYGGSIKSFAQVNPMGDDPPDSVAKQHLYRVAFVPVHSVTSNDPAVLH